MRISKRQLRKIIREAMGHKMGPDNTAEDDVEYEDGYKAGIRGSEIIRGDEGSAWMTGYEDGLAAAHSRRQEEESPWLEM